MINPKKDGGISDFDLTAVQPIANNWVQTEIKYYGYGEAHFQSPKGVVYGPTEVNVSQNGDYSISMEVEKIDYDGVPLPLGLQQLLSAEEPEEVDGALQLSFPPIENNRCTRLQITTSNGRLTAKDFNAYSWTFNVTAEQGFKHSLHFHPSTFEFRTQFEEPPVYWALPLNNYLSYFQQTVPDLAFHPLRIFPSRKVPDSVPTEKKEVAEFVANQMNRLIVFTYLGELGFIEPLEDYKELERKLKSKEALILTTAVMVGVIGRNSIEYEKILDWFPLIFVDLLSFATGIEVGVPWIEIRGGSGQLLRRFHTRLGSALYVNGARVIDEVFHRGTGKLLSNAFDCPDIEESYLKTTIRLTTKGGRYSQSVEDKMNYLCRAFETLSENFGFQKQNLLSEFDRDTIDAVKKTIAYATMQIRRLIRDAKPPHKQLETSYLQRIEARMANAANTDREFGLAVLEILNKFSLHDATIVDKFLLNNPRQDGISNFASLISTFRGRAIHVGYFDFRGKVHDIEDIWIVIQHLHDLLARIVLYILGYEGKYQPTVINMPASENLDWVKPDTQIARLGYEKGKIKYKQMTFKKNVQPKSAS